MRCVWIIGWFTLTTQNLFAWYLLWLLPLIALFVQPGKFLGLKFSAMSAWLIFSGLVGLSYISSCNGSRIRGCKRWSLCRCISC